MNTNYQKPRTTKYFYPSSRWILYIQGRRNLSSRPSRSKKSRFHFLLVDFLNNETDLREVVDNSVPVCVGIVTLYIRLGEALGRVSPRSSSPSCDCRLEWRSHCSRTRRACHGGTSLAMDQRASCHGSFRISLLGVARTFEGGKGDRRRNCSNNCSRASCSKSARAAAFQRRSRSLNTFFFLSRRWRNSLLLFLSSRNGFSFFAFVTLPELNLSLGFIFGRFASQPVIC